MESTDFDSASVSNASNQDNLFFLDKFALRQWHDPHYAGTQINYDPDQFLQRIVKLHTSGLAPLKDGYATFCKHMFVPNFVDAKLGCLPITDDNEKLLMSGYRARTASELPVLSQWFPREAVDPPIAKMLDIILYSREQLYLEQQSMTSKTKELDPMPEATWGIISIKAQDEAEELPMQPITIMRNALGKEEGGSGVIFSRTEYIKSVLYWEKHAIIL